MRARRTHRPAHTYTSCIQSATYASSLMEAPNFKPANMYKVLKCILDDKGTMKTHEAEAG